MRYLTLFFWAISAPLFPLRVDASPAGQALRRHGRCRASTSLLSTTLTTTSSSILETPISTETSTPTATATVSATETETKTDTSSETSTTISLTTSAPDIPTTTLVASDVSTTSTTSAAAPELTTTAAPATSTEATSSSPTAESPAETSTATPDPNMLKNGGFEDEGGWIVQTGVGPQYFYDFSDTRAPHSGQASASVNWASRAPMAPATFRFYQVLNLIPNKQYAFSAWTRASALSTNPQLFCTVSYAIYTPDGSGAYAPFLASLTELTPIWMQSTFTWTNREYTNVRFHIMARCNGGLAPAGGFAIFFDDISYAPL